ncbi:hypothetical protein [Pseudomonas sp. DG56-2]|uniref:hypothetical protein n=1 Tax=Pseudomonas sp. DG56-2 TaxID=2320270 RepID=UPI0010A6707F|nr:hypothetical protein [Pseudomonas sp. DG56-2]
MDTNKMRDSVREQFEKFALSSEGGLFPGHLAKGEDGEYLNYAAQCYWLFWQASREAVVVELPEPDLPEVYIDEPVDRESEEFRYLEARHGAQCQTYRKCRQAIEAQGLKVKP